MVALRSRRLESLFGASLDLLRAEHISGLVSSGAQEAFDLDFKVALYGRGDSDRRALASDVAALANTAGGVLVLGVQEDAHARAVATPGVEITDAEVARIRQVIASLVAPMPTFDVLTIAGGTSEGDEAADHGTASLAQTAAAPTADADDQPARGFILVAVPRSPAGPHAVLVNEALRYPRRNGSTTRYLSEPEVAAAYRERLAGAQSQAERAARVEREALQRLDPSGMPWVVVTLVPDLPGDMPITSELYAEFTKQITGAPATIFPSDAWFRRASVGRRRLLADGNLNYSPTAKRLSLEAHADGSGVYSLCVLDLADRSRQQPIPEGQPKDQLVYDEALVIAVVSGLLMLAQHGRDRTAAGGNALIRAQIYPISAERPTRLGHLDPMGFIDPLGNRVLVDQQAEAEAAAPLDDLAQPGPSLIQAAAQLINEIGHAFGIAELGQISRDGQLRRRYWRQTPINDWAMQHGIVVTDDFLA